MEPDRAAEKEKVIKIASGSLVYGFQGIVDFDDSFILRHT